MRTFVILSLLGVSVAAYSGIDLQAGCRCNRGARREARMERRAARRGGHCQTCPSTYTPSYPTTYSPYEDQVQVVGKVETQEYEVRWQCVPGRGCRPVRVPVTKLKAVPDPHFKPTPAPKVEAPKPDPTLGVGYVEPVGSSAKTDNAKPFEPVREVVFNPTFFDDSGIPDPVITAPADLPAAEPSKPAAPAVELSKPAAPAPEAAPAAPPPELMP